MSICELRTIIERIDTICYDSIAKQETATEVIRRLVSLQSELWDEIDDIEDKLLENEQAV